MEKQYTIKLGERSWVIPAPLKFKQLQVIEPSITAIIHMKASTNAATGKFYDEMANVLLAAITPVDPTFARAVLDELPVEVEELSEAVKIVARAAGMWKDPVPGEAVPSATTATEQPK